MVTSLTLYTLTQLVKLTVNSNSWSIFVLNQFLLLHSSHINWVWFISCNAIDNHPFPCLARTCFTSLSYLGTLITTPFSSRYKKRRQSLKSPCLPMKSLRGRFEQANIVEEEEEEEDSASRPRTPRKNIRQSPGQGNNRKTRWHPINLHFFD